MKDKTNGDDGEKARSDKKKKIKIVKTVVDIQKVCNVLNAAPYEEEIHKIRIPPFLRSNKVRSKPLAQEIGPLNVVEFCTNNK